MPGSTISLAGADDLCPQQLELLERFGLSVDLDPAAACTAVSALWLPAARTVVIDSWELYSAETDFTPLQPLSERNEAAALALLAEKLAGLPEALREVPDVGNGGAAGPIGQPCEDEVSRAAAAWAESRGVRGRVLCATFDGLRGGAAAGDVARGDVFLELPPSAWLTAATARACPVLGPVLEAEGLDDDAAAVLWTMRERALGADSQFAPFFDQLPAARLRSGLTLSPACLARLGETVLAAEAWRLREAAGEEYRRLFPALLRRHPAAFQPHERFSYGCYAAAVELWQAYGARVRSADGRLVTALLPTLLLLNHCAVAPHCARFSVPDADGVLRLRAARACAAGRQLFISYGPQLSNKELLLHYGFTLPRNPHDEVPLCFEEEDGEEGAGERRETAVRLRALLMARWGVGWEHGLRRRAVLPSRLLALLRLLTAENEELVALARTPTAADGGQTGLGPRHRPLSPASELTALETLCGTLRALLDQLPLRAEGVEEARGAGAEAAAAAHCDAYVDSQREILEAALRAAQGLLEAEGGEASNG